MSFKNQVALCAFFVLSLAATAHATDLLIVTETQDQSENLIVEVEPGSDFNYVLIIQDSEEEVMGTDIVVTDRVPDLVGINEVEATWGECTTTGQEVSCNLNGLLDGAFAIITIKATLSPAAEIGSEVANTASVTASNEIEPSNNEDSSTFLVGEETIQDPNAASGGCSLQKAMPRTMAWNFLRLAWLR